MMSYVIATRRNVTRTLRPVRTFDRGEISRGPPRHVSAYEISKSSGLGWISGFQFGFLDFWISGWISGFQNGFLDFRLDFWISRWISGFQSGFLDFKMDFWFYSAFHSGFHSGFLDFRVHSGFVIGFLWISSWIFDFTTGFCFYSELNDTKDNRHGSQEVCILLVIWISVRTLHPRSQDCFHQALADPTYNVNVEEWWRVPAWLTTATPATTAHRPSNQFSHTSSSGTTFGTPPALQPLILMINLSKGANIDKTTKWAVSNFEAWKEAISQEYPDDQVTDCVQMWPISVSIFIFLDLYLKEKTPKLTKWNIL